MAKMLKGVFGDFSGKIGDIVGSSWKGIPVIRQAPSQRRGPFSKSQIEQQARFMLLSRFLRPLTELLKDTFQNSAARMSCFNKAFSVNTRNVIGIYPAFRIDYANVALSSRNMAGNTIAKASSRISGKLVFTWNYDYDGKETLATDIIFVAVYCEELARWIYIRNAAVRTARRYMLDAEVFSGKQVQTWMGFLSANGQKVLGSRYTGPMTVRS
jgi:hypothetical protein